MNFQNVCHLSSALASSRTAEQAFEDKKRRNNTCMQSACVVVSMKSFHIWRQTDRVAFRRLLARSGQRYARTKSASSGDLRQPAGHQNSPERENRMLTGSARAVGGATGATREKNECSLAVSGSPRVARSRQKWKIEDPQ